MADAVKTVVIAIVAIALIYVFFAYFAPYYIWPKNLQKQIRESLYLASINPGKAMGAEETIFDAGTGFSSESFREKQMEVNFECNLSGTCCIKGNACNDAIEWDFNRLVSKQKKAIKTFARCRAEYNVFACTVYVGQKPAQLEIIAIERLEEINLAKTNPYSIDVIAKNAGQVFAPSVFAKAKLFQLKSGGEKELSSEKITPEIELRAGETKMIPIDFEIPIKGNYLVEVRVQGESAGFDENSFEFKATGEIASFCSATSKGSTLLDSTSGQCETSYLCSNCNYAFECKQAWQKKEAQTMFEETDAQHAIVISQPVNGNCQ